MFADFIKNYNIIRNILRDIFLYGCFSREGLENKNKNSLRKISYEIRRIQQYLEQEFIRVDKDGRNKLLNLSYDSIRNTENFLVKTYMAKSFTRSNILLYFYILMILQASSKMYSFRDMENALISKGLVSYDSISSKTIERKLNEMCNSIGILNCETVKRIKYYSVTRDIMKNLDDKEVEELLIAVSMYKNILLPTTAGYYCELTLKDYIKYERGFEIQLKDYFQYRNLPFHPIIEEQILWQILNAIHQKKWVTLQYDINTYRKDCETKNLLKPYKIRYDVNCGRFYLVAFNENDRCSISRLDRIQNVIISNDTYEINKLKELYETYMKYSWSAVPLSDKNELEFVQLEIIIDEPNENYIIERIKSEVQFGNFEKIENGWYHLTMYVNDSLEMLPWIRSYMGYINVIDGKRLKKKFLNDLKEMMNNYGTI